jgi:hypothetical protein
LDDHYGPFIIAGGQFGGSMVIQLKLDTLLLEGEIQVNGKASVEVAVVDGKGDATYRQNGMNRMRGYHPEINIYGGDAHKTESALLGILWSENPDAHEQWTSMLDGWLDSMKEDTETGDMSKAAPISFTAVPIWHFFADTDVAAYVRSYFMNKYRTRGIQEYLDIRDSVPGHKQFIELLNGTRADEPDGPQPTFDHRNTNTEVSGGEGSGNEGTGNEGSGNKESGKEGIIRIRR